MSKIFQIVFLTLTVISIFWLYEQEVKASLNIKHNDQTAVYRIVNVYQHDPQARTEGLVYNNGVLYESLGGYGLSSLRKIELETGNTLKNIDLAQRYYGEGITLWHNQIVQLTWQERIGFVYDLETFELLKSFLYDSEGWGITNDGQSLIMSKGTDTLHFIDPETFIEFGSIQVHDPKNTVKELKLNELEYVDGEIFANISQNCIARISPTTGRVLGWIELSQLYKKIISEPNLGELPDSDNSIAYDEQRNRLFVTGKYWSKLFEIELVRS